MTRQRLAERVRKELRRNPRHHCFIHALELDDIWPNRTDRWMHLYQFAWSNQFALAWQDERIGAIFVDKRRPGKPTAKKQRPRKSRCKGAKPDQPPQS